MAEERHTRTLDRLADRLPPQDLEAEQATLGAMLIDPEAVSRALAIVSEEDFYREAHREILSAIRAVEEAGDPVDVVTVGAELRRRERLAAVGGAEYLTALIGEVPTSAHVVRYATIVHDKAMLRRLIKAGADIQAIAYDNPNDVQTALSTAEEHIFRIAQERSTREYQELGPLVQATFQHLDDVFKKPGYLTGVGTGLQEFDAMTSGLQEGNLVIIAGRPAMGKTSLMINNLAMHAALRERVPVLVFSLEMSNMQLAEMLLCGRARVNSWRLRVGKVRRDDWERIGHALQDLVTAPMYIDDTPAISIMEMRSKARRIKSQHDIGLICVDYLQLATTGRPNPENRHQEIGEVARAMKAMARELNVPVVIGSQLSRNVERREEKRPILSDLAESGSIEAEADLVCFLYRESYYQRKKAAEEVQAEADAAVQRRPEERESQIDIAELIIAKHRNGPVGTVKLAFNQNSRIFDNIDPFRSAEVYE
ncbi:MAG: replicative DNA helicase [Armatimonadota bacterium]